MSSDQSEILQHIGEGAIKYTSEHSSSSIFISTHQHSKKGVKMHTANSITKKPPKLFKLSSLYHSLPSQY